MKPIRVLLVALLCTASLSACSTVSLPAGCDAPADKVSKALEAQSSWQKWSDEPFNDPEDWLGFSFVHNEVLTYPNCFDQTFVAGYEKITGKDANWDGASDYDPEATNFLPTGNITNSVPAEEVALSDDPAVLKKAFKAVLSTVDEGDGIDEDYSFEAGGITAIEKTGTESDRERDKRDFSLRLSFSGQVEMDGTIYFWVTRQFKNLSVKPTDGFSPGIEALCNGMLIEAAGEAFKYPSETDCGRLKPSIGGYYFDLKVDSVDRVEGFERMLAVMATGPFSIFMVDDSGMNHEFRFDKKAADQLKQTLLVFKAVRTGNGY